MSLHRSGILYLLCLHQNFQLGGFKDCNRMLYSRNYPLFQFMPEANDLIADNTSDF